VRLDPKLATAQGGLADVLYAKRDFNGAVQHYRAALAIQPNSAVLHMNLASALDDAGKPDEAIAEYKEAIRLEPKNASAHYNLAIFYLRRKDTATAIAELRQAAKLSPDWPTPHIMLTNLQKDSDPKAALDECVIADGLTNDAKLHNLCTDLQRKVQQGSQ
jgi:tetratricopeptide (TPR) repeat protein